MQTDMHTDKHAHRQSWQSCSTSNSNSMYVYAYIHCAHSHCCSVHAVNIYPEATISDMSGDTHVRFSDMAELRSIQKPPSPDSDEADEDPYQCMKKLKMLNN